MSNVPVHRNVLRLAALTLTALASSLMVAVGGPVAYTFAAAAATLVVLVLATAERDTLRLVGTRFRVEGLLGTAAIVGILATTFLQLPTPMGRVLVPLAALLAAAFLVTITVKTFRMLRAVPRHR